MATRSALAASSTARFRVLRFSIQTDHLHLLLEADTPTGFERGVRGLAIRVAKAVNRALGRAGRVWGDRHHARLLRTPREVRNTLVYVLNKLPKASSPRSRTRSMLVGKVVRRLAYRYRTNPRVLAGCTGAHVACARRLATTGADRRR